MHVNKQFAFCLNIDENSLRDLENRLAAAQRLYDNSQIDDEIEALNRARLMQVKR